MATVSASGKWFANAMVEALKGRVNIPADNIKVMLCNNTYVPSQTADLYKDVVFASAGKECSGTNYTAGGFTLSTGKSVTAAGLVTTFTASGISQANCTVTGIRYLVIYDDTPTSNKPMLCYLDLGTPTDVDGTLSISWNASGIAQITVS